MGAEIFQTIGATLMSFMAFKLVVGLATPSSIFVKREGAMTGRFFILSMLLRGLSLAIGVGVLLAPDFASAAADKRVALVIGNGAYKNAPPLDNPAFDAKAVADAFKSLGFQVVDGYDLDIAEMRAKVSEFSAILPDAKSAVVYYAGHGVSVDEENYLIPTDIVLKNPTDLDLGAIGVSLLLKQMKREDRVNVVILDACRDNPFAAALAKNKTRAIVDARGLSRIDGDLARGTLIAFASDPKSTALDGPAGQHSPFTGAFLDHVADPGVSIDTVMSRVRTEVWEKTKHNQLPWVNTSLIGDYALNPQASSEGAADVEKGWAGAPSSPTATNEKQANEDLLWESAQHSNLGADYQAYLDAFPNGLFAQMARNRIASLEGAGASRTAPAPETSAPAEPAASSEKDFKSEIGTIETEKALNLTPANQMEIQQRLIVLEFYEGPANGALDSSTRSAIAQWQESRGLSPTSFLGSLQLAALRAESESMYERYLAAQPAPRHDQAIRRGTRSSTSAKPPSAPVRHWAHRSSPPVAAAAASAAATPDPGGTPAWRRRAGLPDNSPTPGRPPGF